MATVLSGGAPTGVAFRISGEGRFIVHRSAIGLGIITLKLVDGRNMLARVTGSDDLTGLSLIEVQSGLSSDSNQQNSRPAAVATSGFANEMAVQGSKGIPLLVVSVAGVSRAELYDTERIGIAGANRRGLTLAEIRFESPRGSVGGSLAFSLDGQLVGVVGATLEPEATAKTMRAGAETLGAAGSSGQPLVPYGPQGLTIAYSITSDILNRVVEGFRSEKREVLHPALGLMVQDGAGSARVVSVTKGGAADKASLMAGDEILQIGDTKIARQVDYTRFIIRRTIGETLSMRIRRNGAESTLTIIVGAG